jgi:hypothetical protein
VQLLRQYFCAKKLQSQNATREKLRETLLNKNLSVNVDEINAWCPTFYKLFLLSRSQKSKKTLII